MNRCDKIIVSYAIFPRAQVLSARGVDKVLPRVNGIVNLSSKLPDELSMKKILWISLVVLSFVGSAF